MTDCKHIVISDDVREALEFGINNYDDIYIQPSDDSGSFTLVGLKCVKCNESVGIEFCQHPEDTKYVEILAEELYEELNNAQK